MGKHGGIIYSTHKIELKSVSKLVVHHRPDLRAGAFPLMAGVFTSTLASTLEDRASLIRYFWRYCVQIGFINDEYVSLTIYDPNTFTGDKDNPPGQLPIKSIW